MLANGRGNLTAKNTTSAPDSCQSSGKRVSSIGSHRRLRYLQRLSQSRDFEPVFQSHQQNALFAIIYGTYMLSPAPSSKLLNLTGFFSGIVALLDIVDIKCSIRGPDQGKQVLLRRKGVESGG